MRYLNHVLAELVAVLTVQVRLRNSRMANSYGLWREAPRGAELLHSALSHTVLVSRECRDRIEQVCVAQAKCFCSSHDRKPAYRFPTSAPLFCRCALCTHRTIHVQGVRAWVRSAAAVAASLPTSQVAAAALCLCLSPGYDGAHMVHPLTWPTQLLGSPASPQRAGRWSPWTPEKGR